MTRGCYDGREDWEVNDDSESKECEEENSKAMEDESKHASSEEPKKEPDYDLALPFLGMSTSLSTSLPCAIASARTSGRRVNQVNNTTVKQLSAIQQIRTPALRAR